MHIKKVNGDFGFMDFPAGDKTCFFRVFDFFTWESVFFKSISMPVWYLIGEG